MDNFLSSNKTQSKEDQESVYMLGEITLFATLQVIITTGFIPYSCHVMMSRSLIPRFGLRLDYKIDFIHWSFIHLIDQR